MVYGALIKKKGDVGASENKKMGNSRDPHRKLGGAPYGLQWKEALKPEFLETRIPHMIYDGNTTCGNA